MITSFKRKPQKIVLLFCVSMIVMYIDRGCIGALLPKIQLNWGDLTGTQSGAIQSAFVIGFAICCPIFAQLNTKFPQKVHLLISLGFFMWSISALLCGIFGQATRGSREIWGYYCFVISRVCIGIGEAAFIPLSVSIVDDISSNENRSIYQSMLMAMQPVGIALGYSLGGGLVSVIRWPYVFIVECAFGVVLAIVFLFVPIYDTRVVCLKRKNKLTQQALLEVEEKKKKKPNLITSTISLLTNPVYMCQCIAQAQYSAVIGALVFWAPTWIYSRLKPIADMKESTKLFVSNFGFSIIVLVASLVGTIVGGVLLDQWNKYSTRKLESDGVVQQTSDTSITYKAFAVCAVFVGLAFPIGMTVFVWRKLSIYLLFPLLGSAILTLFVFNSPSQIALLSSVSTELRDFAVSFNILVLHVLGDFPSPTVFGWIADLTHSLDYANACLWLCVFVASMAYGLGFVISYIKYKRGRILVQSLDEEEEKLQLMTTTSTTTTTTTTSI